MKLIALGALLAFAIGCSSKDKMEAKNAANAETTKVAEKMTPAVTAESSIKCSLAKSHRLIEVVKKDKGCELFYTRDGDRMSKATSDNGTAHCMKIADNIKANLGTAGFTCQ